VPILIIVFIGLTGLAALLSFRSMVTSHRKIEAAVHAETWVKLTDGRLAAERTGALLTFWASGRPRSGMGRSTALDVFVAIDNGALVMVQPQPWPRRPVVNWVVRTDEGPLLRVTEGWWGPIISEQESGFMLQRPNHTCEQVTLDLRRRGWKVDGVPSLEELPPPP